MNFRDTHQLLLKMSDHKILAELLEIAYFTDAKHTRRILKENSNLLNQPLNNFFLKKVLELLKFNKSCNEPFDLLVNFLELGG